MKKKLLLFAMAISLSLWSVTPMAKTSIKVIESISGKSLKAIQIALPEFLKRGLSLDDYRVVVMEVNGRTTVLFEDTYIRDGQLGSSRLRSSFEVELNIDSTLILRSNFVR